MGYIFARGVITFLHVLLLFFTKLNFILSNMMMMMMKQGILYRIESFEWQNWLVKYYEI